MPNILCSSSVFTGTTWGNSDWWDTAAAAPSPPQAFSYFSVTWGLRPCLLSTGGHTVTLPGSRRPEDITEDTLVDTGNLSLGLHWDMRALTSIRRLLWRDGGRSGWDLELCHPLSHLLKTVLSSWPETVLDSRSWGQCSDEVSWMEPEGQSRTSGLVSSWSLGCVWIQVQVTGGRWQAR